MVSAIEPPAATKTKGRILIVDDELVVRDSLGKWFTSEGYTARQAGYDLRKLRGKGLVAKLGRTRRYHVPSLAARTIAALLALRDQVIAPILAGIRSPQRRGRRPASWTAVDRDYETLRIGMQALFQHLGIHAALPAT